MRCARAYMCSLRRYLPTGRHCARQDRVAAEHGVVLRERSPAVHRTARGIARPACRCSPRRPLSHRYSAQLEETRAEMSKYEPLLLEPASRCMQVLTTAPLSPQVRAALARAAAPTVERFKRGRSRGGGCARRERAGPIGRRVERGGPIGRRVERSALGAGGEWRRVERLLDECHGGR